MRARAVAAASEPLVEAAASEQLAAGGSALDAVLAGVFTAAGASPGVLLGPLTILIGGVGQGARAFDGRIRQPGLGAKRPRGLVSGESVPGAARVGAPTALAAALVAHAYGKASLRSVVRPGIVAAERANAPERARLLERVAQVGASALSEASYRRGLLRVGSPSEGGLLTLRDLEAPQDIDVPAVEQSLDGTRLMVAPWAASAAAVEALGRGAAVAAIDVHGTVAAGLYRLPQDGIWIEELQMLAPQAAVPVERGVPRVAPGTRLPVPSPAAIIWDAQHGPVEIVVEPDSALLVPATPTSTRWTLRRNPATRLVESRTL